MTNKQRIEMARQWRDAAIQRRDYSNALISGDEVLTVWEENANLNTADGMQDRINVINSLFPELQT